MNYLLFLNSPNNPSGQICKNLEEMQKLLKKDTTISLDLDLIKKGAKKLIGTHDYSVFRASSCHAKSPIKTINSIKIKSLKDEISYRWFRKYR